MKCPNCDADVTLESKFCHRCGTPLDGDVKSNTVADEAAHPDAGYEKTAAERLREKAGASAGESDVEKEIWHGGYSGKAMIGLWIAAGLGTIAAFVIAVAIGSKTGWTIISIAIAVTWLALVIKMYYSKWSVRYELTNQRFVHRSGILSRTTDRIEVIDMDDVTLRQGLLDRLVGVGEITISSSDSTHPKLVLKGIEDVQNVADIFDKARRKERRRRGLHIESI